MRGWLGEEDRESGSVGCEAAVVGELSDGYPDRVAGDGSFGFDEEAGGFVVDVAEEWSSFSGGRF